ncbi:protein serine/threonine phosphatase [Aureococcus anophagefferens]|nr:protein serine/threonine phosphatase [Aureococcus anophagefferens]
MVNRHICIIALCSLFRCFAQPEPCTTCPHYVKKTVDAPARFLFIAGLEGSGHHSLSNMFAMCVRRRVLCRHDRELGQLLHGNRSHPTGIFVYGRQAAADIAALRKRFFARLQHLRDARGTAARRALLNVNADGATIPDAGMMSYPNFGPPDKMLHHPDMQTLATMAEAAGADLRVLVVLRGARETLVSTSVHRLGEFPPWPEEAAVLGNSAAALASELALVDPRFVVCAPFAVATDPGAHRGAWASRLGPALHPGLDTRVAVLAEGSGRHDRGRQDAEGDPRAADAAGRLRPHVEHVEKMLGLVDAACRRRGGVYVEAEA